MVMVFISFSVVVISAVHNRGFSMFGKKRQMMRRAGNASASSSSSSVSDQSLPNGTIARSDSAATADEPSVFFDSTRAKQMLTGAYNCWQNGLYSDVTIVVEEQKFPAHRIVLSSLSEYFRPLFELDVKNSREVTLRNIKPEDFEVLLHYAYTGEMNISNENAQSLLIAADYLSVESVKRECIRFMVSSLDVDNVCDALMFAVSYSLTDLERGANKFLKENLDSVSRTSSFLRLDPEYIVKVFEEDGLILYNNGIILKNVEREKLIFDAVLRYLHGRSEKELQLVEMMIRTVRLPVLPKDVMKKSLSNFKSLKKNEIVKKYVYLREVALKYLHEREQDYSLTTAIGKEAEEIPVTWFQSRRFAFIKIISGRTRYASGGQVANFPHPPAFENNNNSLEIARIDLWLRRWDGRPVIGGLALAYRKPLSEERVLEYQRGNTTSGEHHVVQLEPNEYIVKVIIGSGWLIDRLGFETSRGKIYGPYGGPGGSEHTETAPQGNLSYLFDINCDATRTQGSQAILNLMFRWITFE